MKREITEIAKKNWVDLVRFAPAERFDKNDPIFRIMPEVKTVICFGYQLLRGMFRGIEEGSTYYQYTTMAVETLDRWVFWRWRDVGE